MTDDAAVSEAVRIKIRRVGDVIASVLGDAHGTSAGNGTGNGTDAAANGHVNTHASPHPHARSHVETTLHIGKREILLLFRVKVSKLDRETCKLAGDIAAATLDANCEAIDGKELTIFKCRTTTARIKHARESAEFRANLYGNAQKILFISAVVALAASALKVLQMAWNGLVG